MGRRRVLGVVIRGLMTGESTSRGDYAAFVRTKLVTLAARANVELPDAGAVTVDQDAPVPAFVAQGKWVVDCPDCGRNRSMVWVNDLIYMCPACWNAGTGGHWRPVVMPSDAADIEAALLARPLPQSRNMVPGETAADLRHENREKLGIE